MHALTRTLLAISGGATVCAAQSAPAPDALAPRGPAPFVENRGQWAEPVRYRVRRGPATVWFESRGFVVGLAARDHARTAAARDAVRAGTGLDLDRRPDATHAFRIAVAGADPRQPVVGEAPVPTRFSFYRGGGRVRGIEGARGFRRLRWPAIRPGVDLVVGDRDGRLHYDLELAPGVDPASVVLEVEGVDGLRVAADGALVLATPLGEVRQTAPVTFAVRPDGTRRPVRSWFEPVGARSYRFGVGGRDPALPLIVDPGLDWASFFGGSDGDFAWAQALDDQERQVLVGFSSSFDYPMTLGTFGGGTTDAYAVLIDPSRSGPAQIVWSTWLGGAACDYATEVAASAAGITLVGFTDSTDFPTVDPYQGASGGGWDAFAARLAADGTLRYATYLGTAGHDRAASVAVDAATGAITLGGFTDSTAFPTTPGVVQPSLAGDFDMFVARLDPSRAGNAQLSWSTFLGGTGKEGLDQPQPSFNWDLQDLHVAADGTVAVASRSLSSDFPTTSGAFQERYRGGINADATFTLLDANGQSLVYSTYLGSTQDDAAAQIALDADGVYHLAGLCWGADFPVTPGAYETNYVDRNEGLYVKLHPGGNGAGDLRYATLLTGMGFTFFTDLVVEPSGVVTLVGPTSVPSGIRATPGAHRVHESGGSTGFVARLDPRGTGQRDLHYLSFVGAGAVTPGPDLNEVLLRVSIRRDGSFVMSGGTDNPAYPVTSGAFQQGYGGGARDVVVVAMDLLPEHVVPFGFDTEACLGPIYPQVNSDPVRGNASFELQCLGAPPNTIGLFLLSGQQRLQVLFGAFVFPFDPLVVPSTTDARGVARTGLPIPANIPNGLRIATQYVWLNTQTCGPFGNLSASRPAWILP